MGAWERDFGRQLHLLLDPGRPGQRTRASCKPNGSTLSNLEKTLKTKITTVGNSATPQAPLTERNGAHTARPHVVQKLRFIAFFLVLQPSFNGTFSDFPGKPSSNSLSSSRASLSKGSCLDWKKMKKGGLVDIQLKVLQLRN